MTRFLSATLLLIAATATCAGAELRQLSLEGVLRNGVATRAVQLRLQCEPGPRGAISLELWVPQAAKLADFDYDDFEGPDAAAADSALSHVEITGAAPAVEITHAAAGWYAGDDPDTFVFALNQVSHQKGALATMLRAVGAKYDRLSWTQRGFGEHKLEMRAEFVLDPAATERIRATVAECLTAVTKAKPAKKN